MDKEKRISHVWELFQCLTGGIPVSVPGASYDPGTMTVTHDEFEAMSQEERHRFFVDGGGRIEEDCHTEFEGALETDEEAFEYLKDRYEDALLTQWPDYNPEFGVYSSSKFNPNAKKTQKQEQRDMQLRAIFAEGFESMTPRRWLILGLMIGRIGDGSGNIPAVTEVRIAAKRLFSEALERAERDGHKPFQVLHEMLLKSGSLSVGARKKLEQYGKSGSWDSTCNHWGLHVTKS